MPDAELDLRAIVKGLSLADVRRAIYEKSYYRFFLKAWEIVEHQTELIPNWHIEFICNLLQAEAERVAGGGRRSKDLIINIPPRSGKSNLVTIFFNAWAWIQFPGLKFITASYGADLASSHSRKTRDLIESAWFQENWGDRFKIKDDINRLNEYENDKGGMRRAVGAGAGITGKGADFIIIDDPQDPRRAYSETERDEVNRWYDQTIYTRLNDQAVGVRVIVMQRLHENDLVGHVLSHSRDDFRRITIPAEMDREFDIHPPELKKEYRDGLYFPERFPRDVLNNFRKVLGARGYANQMGQSPAPDAGQIFKREWFTRRWKVLPGDLDVVIQSWDMAFKDTADGSKVVGQVWGKRGGLIFLIDQIRERLDFNGTIAAFLSMTKRHPAAWKKLVEDKANGPALISSLSSKVPGIIGVPKRDSKEAASYAVTPIWESGNVILPDQPWVEEFIEEHVKFPAARDDDQVDAANQAIRELMQEPKKGSDGMLLL